MRRWLCPSCGSGVNAPDKPRMDDARRYCLACTAKTGKLVKRTCPALDRKRAVSSERQAAKRSFKATRAKVLEDAKWTIGGYDLRKEAKRIWNLPTFRELPYAHWAVPKLDIRRSSKWHTTGRAAPYTGVTMTVGTDPGYALEVLLHELLHCALGQEENGKWHTATFWNRIRSGMKEAWPQVDFKVMDCPQRGYAVDHYMASGLSQWLRGEGS